VPKSLEREGRARWAREAQCRRMMPVSEVKEDQHGTEERVSPSKVTINALAVSAPLTPASSGEANSSSSVNKLQKTLVMATRSFFCSAEDPPFHFEGDLEGEPGACKPFSVCARRSLARIHDVRMAL